MGTVGAGRIGQRVLQRLKVPISAFRALAQARGKHVLLNN